MLIAILIFCNVILQVLFRLLPHYNVRNLNAITINYFTCLLLGCTITSKWPFKASVLQEGWFPYAFTLSIIFIIFFNVNAYSIQKVGMVITSVFQKLSLVFPVILGLLFFGESIRPLTYVAFPITVLAIMLTQLPSGSSGPGLKAFKNYWYLPFLVILGSGIIEVVLFYIQEKGITGTDNKEFTTSLFGMAGMWGLLSLALKKQLDFNKNEFITGIAIGIPNFFTIYLILRGLELGWKGAILFPTNNVGTILFTALVGIFIFQEKLSRANYLGLVFALISVLLFSLS